MLRHTLALAALATLLVACSENNPTAPSVRQLAPPQNAPADVSAAASDHSLPGTPGEPGCKGQTTAYIAQLSKSDPENFAGAHGIGGIAQFTGLSVKEIKAIVDTYCAGV